MIADGQALLARQVAEKFNYARIRAMDMLELHVWADQAGLSIEELARIQPGYAVEPPYPYVSAWLPYIQAAIVAGVGTSAINIVTLVRKRTSWIVPCLGILIGLVLLVFGLVERGAPADAFIGFRGIENPFGELDVLVGGVAVALGSRLLYERLRLGKRQKRRA
jgi:hypothetical protein